MPVETVAATAAGGSGGALLAGKKALVTGLAVAIGFVTTVVVVAVVVITVATNAACQAMIDEQRDQAGRGTETPPLDGDVDGHYPDAVDRVVAISVDGLNIPILRDLGPEDAPNIYRLLNRGASTLNARTMVEQTVTLPNHVSMVTGRRINKAAGGHGVTWNTDRRGGPTIQQAAGHPVSSVFTQVARTGASTAVFSTKVKFSIFDHSWPQAVDRTTIYDHNDNRIAAAAVQDLRNRRRAFTFVHFGLPDETGHEHGWDSSQYAAAVERVDRLVGQIMRAARSGSGKTSIILTADHGGHGPGHSNPDLVDDYRIPFAIYGPGIEPTDLYAINPDYRDPGSDQPSYRGPQPVRNGDLANVALRLLGLEPVPGSIFGDRETLDPIEGTAAVSGRITTAVANFPPSTSNGGLAASMRTLTGGGTTDFVFLNEVFNRSLPFLRSTAPGYGAYRDPRPDRTPGGAGQSMNNVVMWNTERWRFLDGGRVKVVDNDHAYYKGRRVLWDRFATWALMKRKSDGAVVPIISLHMPTNPGKFRQTWGNTGLTRIEVYARGMDRVLELVQDLSRYGPVLLGGDMNSFPDQRFSAAARMTRAGYRYVKDRAVMYLFYPPGVQVARHRQVHVVSDHPAIVTTLEMGGNRGRTSRQAVEPVVDVDEETSTTAARQAAPAADLPDAASVEAQLMQIRFGAEYPTMTAEQARNAITIAQVARELRVPRFGLQIAIATAIQESKLVNLHSGDADSQGLFQQRPSAGWGTVDQITNPRLATLAFFGRAQHTSNGGLLDIPGWQQMELTEAAQAVQVSRYPDAYAEWEDVSGQISDILGGDLPDSVEPLDQECLEANDALAPYTVGTLNLLGAGHTDAGPGGGHTAHGYATWERRLPRALDALEARGVTVAGVQEVHRPQAHALATTYSDQWGMWPKNGNAQNRVIWDPGTWQMTDARSIDIPYFHGHEVGMPLVQLTSRATGQAIWVWSIHNPASTRGNARALRVEALRRQLDTLESLKDGGLPVFIVGDFNDGRDGQQSAHCTLTPELSNAFGAGGTSPCQPPRSDAPIDHIFGTNVQFASATVDRSTQARKISDHPLVFTTTLGSTAGCPPTGSPAERGLTPDALLALRSVNAQFGPHTYAGVGDRPNASDHPSGRAVDVMIANWDNPAGIAEGNRITAWLQAHARELGITYLIWRDRIWNTGDRGWSPYTHPNGPTSSPTLRHLDHVHASVEGNSGTGTCGTVDPGQVVYPIPANLAGSDRHNWHDSGSRWGSWHTGTDFSVPCGTPVLAAHGGVIRIENGPDWYGRWLVKVETGPDSLTTWYAHMQSVDVADGQTVTPGQQIGAVGSLGNSSGCHLHFEVHLRNGSIYGPDNTNPSTWLAQHVGRSAA